ncbi:MAG TPA: hypothetical protein VE152_07250 [Acidimicrobiales bacterium]|jgi:hypothetical protein|nr:hypothetical protein [Acidimicrobiales bacterium]
MTDVEALAPRSIDAWHEADPPVGRAAPATPWIRDGPTRERVVVAQGRDEIGSPTRCRLPEPGEGAVPGVQRPGAAPRVTEDAIAMAPGDRLLCAVMVLDTVTSAAMVVMSLVTTPVLVLLGSPPVLLGAVGLMLIIVAVALAAMGALTAGILMRSLARGHIELPEDLWLPLPTALQVLPPRADQMAPPLPTGPSPHDSRPTT